MSDGLALSALDWWQEAGIDTIVDDAPHDWLAPAKAPARDESAPVLPSPAAAVALPGELGAFRRWLLAEADIPGPAAARLDASGDPASGTMIMLDMPEAEDRAAARLLSGAVGELFDRMLAAIGLERASAYLAPFSPARPAAGRLSEAHCQALAAVARHHIALVRPRRLLLLGEAPIKALLGLPLTAARGQVRAAEFDGVTVATVASCHPRYVHMKPDLYRRPTWDDLQLFRDIP